MESFSASQSGEQLTLFINQRLDWRSVGDFARLYNDYQALAYVVDMSECEYLDSSGLGSLLELYNRARVAGGHVLIKHCNEKVSDIFQITGLNQIFQLEH